MVFYTIILNTLCGYTIMHVYMHLYLIAVSRKFKDRIALRFAHKPYPRSAAAVLICRRYLFVGLSFLVYQFQSNTPSVL
ncbi:hypothetical protein L2E82_45513 [Cichorium intybus]|uniref:Uncharacterized protein n=1 Tax=Cichorium intybus TaxID=13427 RepID=A0ACB8ZTI6_CICIN|nr:hypothetical protein L2E82_45513 [Cichorium intybus]